MARPSIYKINHDYFNEIDSHDKAYLLGFIFADGHVYARPGPNGGRHYGVSFGIHKRDVEVLNEFTDRLDSTYPIKPRKEDYVTLCATNKQLALNIKDIYGVPNDKSGKLDIPNIRDEFLNSFLLGVFDGDGSLSIHYKKTNKDFLLTYTGSRQFLNQIKTILDERFGLDMYLRPRYEETNLNSWMLEQKGPYKLKPIMDWLYRDAPFSLSRKKEKRRELDTYIKSKPKGTRLHEEVILEKYINGVTQKEISTEMGIGYSAIRGFIQRSRRRGLCP